MALHETAAWRVVPGAPRQRGHKRPQALQCFGSRGSAGCGCWDWVVSGSEAACGEEGARGDVALPQNVEPHIPDASASRIHLKPYTFKNLFLRHGKSSHESHALVPERLPMENTSRTPRAKR